MIAFPRGHFLAPFPATPMDSAARWQFFLQLQKVPSPRDA